jgi:hypothetical protein
MHDYCNSINWPGWLTLFTTTIVGCIAVYIARQQWRTNREKLRLDLYQKRFSVYESTLAYHQLVILPSTISNEEKDKIGRDFIKACRESQFLFSFEDGVFNLLNEIRQQAYFLANYKTPPASDDPEIFKQSAQRNFDANKFLHEDSIPKLEDKLAKYLNFHRLS